LRKLAWLRTPFGGFKNGGLGRGEGVDELLSSTETKTIHLLLAERRGIEGASISLLNVMAREGGPSSSRRRCNFWMLVSRFRAKIAGLVDD
jgi:hypothetical protein